MLCLDLDGTLIPYNEHFRFPKALNMDVVRELSNTICIATNQGGVSLKRDDRPTVEMLARRINYAVDGLFKNGVSVSRVFISFYHPKAQIQDMIDATMSFSHQSILAPCFVNFNEKYRKPSPNMLIDLNATEYWGDSDEDELAAQYANIKFKRIKRFIYGDV